MPVAIGAAILTALDVAADTTVLGVSLASVVGFTVLSGAAIGLAELLAPGAPKSAGQQQTVKQSMPSRVLAGGLVKVGGALFFIQTQNGNLYQGVYHCEGPINRYREWWLGSTQTTIAAGSLGGPAGVTPWVNQVVIESHLGAVDQAASPMLLSAFPGSWTEDHHLYGCAYSVFGCYLPGNAAQNFQKDFPSGAPQLRVTIEAAFPLDFRTGTTGWTRNGALLIGWYLTHPDGLNVPANRLNTASFAAFADLCDQPVALKGGGTIPRYQLGVVANLTDQPRTTMAKLLQACDARLVILPDGTIGIQGGQWIAPTVTITDDWIISYEYSQSNDVFSAFDRLKLSYSEPNADFQVVQGQDWVVVGSDGSLPSELECDVAQSHSQIRRVGKIYTAKKNPAHLLTIVVDARWMLLVGEYSATLQLAELGLDETFYIAGLVPADNGVSAQVTIASLGPEAYSWDADSEEGTAPAYQVTAPIIDVAPLPQGVDIEPVRTAITSTTTAVRARLTVDEPQTTDENGNPTFSDWTLDAQYRVQGATDWTDMDTDPSDQDAALTDYLADGTTYEFQARFTGLGQDSDWVGPITFEAIADGTAPAPVSGFGSSLSGSTATLTWTNPTSSNFASAHVYRGTSSSFAAATLIMIVTGAPGSAGSYADSGLASGTYRYWVTAANGSGVESAPPATPQTVTVA